MTRLGSDGVPRRAMKGWQFKLRGRLLAERRPGAEDVAFNKEPYAPRREPCPRTISVSRPKLPRTYRQPLALAIRWDKPMPVGSRWEGEAVPMEVVAVSGRVIMIGLSSVEP